MKTLTMLLAAYVVMSGSHTYREVFIQAIDKTGASRIECGNSRETCSDLAMLLNEARERRLGRSMRVCISEDKPLRFVPCE